ncbi:rab11 family-interacting protein 1 [Anopheles darlingi]|uniref:rab11 family-interacting protein 1 n=1 Tax=Anopheles darlingi TaxID=43151 RepID=UPI0021000269|nr:rab11 family-interacting protein 1 [Anopheles darlingi]
MWSPTHIQVTVQRARGLLIKGKQGSNNCFVIIALGKEKYQTSVQEKAPAEAVSWNEECELQIPSQGNQAQLVLTALHHNSVGMDEFLGRVVLPLNEMEIYERPRSRWYKLESKDKDRERKKEKDRGELEVRISFTVKAGSLTDLSKKTASKSSISNLASSVGGSLLSIGAIEKRKGLRKLAKSLGSKMHISGLGRKGGHKDRDETLDEEVGGAVGTGGGEGGSRGGGGGARTGTSSSTKQTFGDADPGVISEDEDEFVLDNLSHKSSTGSVSQWSPSVASSAHGFQRHPATELAYTSTPAGAPSAPFGISKASSSNSLAGATTGEIIEPEVGKQRQQAKEKMDEWEQKLYGKHLEIGSTDSLKRRSWESSRVMQSAARQEELQQQQQQQQQEAVGEPATLAAPEPQARSVPTSPELDGMASRAAPKPVPRAGSRQDVSRHGGMGAGELVPETIKPEKESFTKKIKHLIKDHGHHHQRADSLENLTAVVIPQRKLNGSKQGSPFGHEQRIIIGGETVGTELGQRAAAKAAAAAAAASMPLAPQTLAKYEGKSHEDMVRVVQGLENEVYSQKQKVKELEDYLDSLLLKVMECHPKILQNPYQKANPTKSG